MEKITWNLDISHPKSMQKVKVLGWRLVTKIMLLLNKLKASKLLYIIHTQK